MSFRVRVKTIAREYQFFAIATDAGALFDDAYDIFGVCSVSVKPVGVTA
ncbi:hypothetical protein [Undibacterium rugosum]|nr:hypothetical protein [Undibacterium rugosum]MBR7777396.1 hypothetical protein [Undibacterium rugosum]